MMNRTCNKALQSYSEYYDQDCRSQIQIMILSNKNITINIFLNIMEGLVYRHGGNRNDMMALCILASLFFCYIQAKQISVKISLK